MIPRERFRQDKPPYDVDDERYNRYKTEKNAFNVVSKEDTGETQPFGFLEKLRERQAEIIQEDIEGYSRLDYALQKGAQAVNLLIGSYGQEAENSQFLKWNPLNIPDYMRESRASLGSRELTHHVKEAAMRYGADLVGCTELDKRWVFSENIYKPIVFKEADKPEETDEELIIPNHFTHAVVMGIAMSKEDTLRSPKVAAATTTDWGYSRMGIASVSLAEYIRALGYQAIPCMNDTALSTPLAIDAGLGQLGRNGLLITPEYGPNQRLCKVLTDIPLEQDHPIDFGVTEFCNQCLRCVEECPAEAISRGDMTREGVCSCNNPGVEKWPVDTLECLRFWQENGIWCSNCQAACPFTRGFEGTDCVECQSCVPDCPLQKVTYLREKYLE